MINENDRMAGAVADEPLLAVGMAEHRCQSGEVFLQTLLAGRVDGIAHALSDRAIYDTVRLTGR